MNEAYFADASGPPPVTAKTARSCTPAMLEALRADVAKAAPWYVQARATSPPHTHAEPNARQSYSHHAQLALLVLSPCLGIDDSLRQLRDIVPAHLRSTLDRHLAAIDAEAIAHSAQATQSGCTDVAPPMIAAPPPTPDSPARAALPSTPPSAPSAPSAAPSALPPRLSDAPSRRIPSSPLAVERTSCRRERYTPPPSPPIDIPKRRRRLARHVVLPDPIGPPHGSGLNGGIASGYASGLMVG